MKKLRLIILLAILFSGYAVSYAQPLYDWAKKIGNSSGEEAYKIGLDASNNVYIMGKFYYTVDFDPSPGTYTLTASTNGYPDIFFAKYDTDGNFVWAKNIGNPSAYSISGEDMAVDAAGNIYLTGGFSGTTDFDPNAGVSNLTSANSDDIFFAKYNSNGSYVWAKSLSGPTGGDMAKTIHVDASGNLYIAGYFNTVDFDPGAGTANLSSGLSYWATFYAKYDPSGNYVWAKGIASANASAITEAIYVDNAGNVYIAGQFSNTVDFDPGPGISNVVGTSSWDIFFGKYDSNGNYLWANGIGSNGSDIANVIVADANDNVWVAGEFQGTADFNTGAGTYTMTSAGGTDGFFGKYDSNGNYIFAENIGSTNSEVVNDIRIDVSGNILLTGYYSNNTDFDPGVGTVSLASAGSLDIFIAKYNSSGNYLWAKGIGSTSTDMGRALTLDAVGNLYVTGYFNNTADFDPNAGTANLTSSGSSDVFFAKYYLCESFSVTISNNNVTCYGGNDGSATANLSGGLSPYTFLWNTNATTQTITGLPANTYSLIVTETHGCTQALSTTVVEPAAPPVVPICLVTVDSASDYNMIVWDKPVSASIDSFIIYRDTANNNYAPIGKVLYDSLSWFIDTVRTLYAANGDPNVSSWRYKLAVMDTCGNIGAMSPYHQTIFIQCNGGNFDWNHYEIEGQPVPVPALSQYHFDRADNVGANYNTIQILSASSTAWTDPQYSSYQSTGSWKVKTQWSISCTPTLKNPQPMGINTSRSNNYKTTGPTLVDEPSLESLISISPNPNTGQFAICTSQIIGNQYELKIYNLFGEKMHQTTLDQKQEVISLQLPSGIYFAHIKTGMRTVVKKMVINR